MQAYTGEHEEISSSGIGEFTNIVSHIFAMFKA